MLTRIAPDAMVPLTSALRIKIYSVSQDGVMHSDVELFLPAIRNAAVQVIETVDEFCAENG